MDRYSSTGCLILAFACSVIGPAYACDQFPTAVISGGVAKCVGDRVYFDGSASHDNDENGQSIAQYTWTFPGAAYDKQGLGTAHTSCRFNAAGTHTVKLKVKDDEGWDSQEASCSVEAVEIASISVSKSVVCAGENVSLTVGTYPPGHYELVTWSGGGSPPTQGGGQTFTTQWDSGGSKTVTVTCYSSGKSKTVEVITGLTVFPYGAHVCMYGTKTYQAWVCQGGIAVQKTSSDGVVWSATRGAFMGDVYTPSSVGSGSVTAQYQGNIASTAVTNFKCDVTSADVAADKIHVELTPDGLTGTLKLELTGATSYTIREAPRSSGSYDETFDITNVPSGEYMTVRATWTIGDSPCSDDCACHIKVLGVYRHSRYNLPNEVCYTGAEEAICNTTGNCTVTPCQWVTGGHARISWLAALDINGSGYSTTLGYVTIERWCQTHGYPPPGGCTGHLLRDLSISGGCPKCTGLPLTANQTVAVNPANPDLGCGDTVFVVGVGTRIVTDHGGGLSTTQLDHFVGLSDCSTVTDIGNLTTVKVY